MSRPSSNSQVYWPWNSWKESFDRIMASALSAICEDEGIAAADGAGRAATELAGEDRGLVLVALGRVDAMAEGGVDDDGELIGGMFGQEGSDRFVELAEAGEGAAFGRDVGAVDDDVVVSHARWSTVLCGEPRCGPIARTPHRGAVGAEAIRTATGGRF